MNTPHDELDIAHSIDMEAFNLELSLNIKNLKAKDIFGLIDVHEKALRFLREAGQGNELPRDLHMI